MNFNMVRLLLAVSAFAFAFGAFSYLGVAGAVVSVWVGFSVGLICLIVRVNQIWPMIRTGLCTIFGGFVGLMFCPMVHPPHNPGDEFGYIGIGGLVGFAVGVSMTASQKRKSVESSSQNENA